MNARGRWFVAGGLVALIAVGLLVPTAMSGFAATNSADGVGGSGLLALSVDGNCNVVGPTSASATCSTNILPNVHASNSISVANTGSVAVNPNVSVQSCAIDTVATSGSIGQTSVVDGLAPSSVYGMAGGPLGGVGFYFSGVPTTEITSLAAATTASQVYTESAWFYVTSYNAGALMGFSDSVHPSGASTNSDRQIWIDPAGFLVAGASNGSQSEVMGTSTIPLDTWNLVTVVLDTHGLILYLNGVREITDKAIKSGGVYNGWWSIGSAQLSSWAYAPALQPNGVSYFTGQLAGISVLPVALPIKAVQALYRSTTFAAYETQVANNNPVLSVPLQDTAPTLVSLVNSANVCSYDNVTLAATISGTTTCVLPSEPTGTACPSSSSTSLYGLSNAPTATVPAGSSESVSVNINPSSSQPANLVNADVLIDAVVGASLNSWTVSAAFPGTINEL